MTLRRLVVRAFGLAALVPFFVNGAHCWGAGRRRRRRRRRLRAGQRGRVRADCRRCVGCARRGRGGERPHRRHPRLHPAAPPGHPGRQRHRQRQRRPRRHRARRRQPVRRRPRRGDRRTGPGALRGSPVQATAAAARHVGLAPTERLVVVEQRGRAADGRRPCPTAGSPQRAIPAELVWLPLESGAVRLAWTVEIEQTDGQHWWVVRVDAATGAVLRTRTGSSTTTSAPSPACWGGGPSR